MVTGEDGEGETDPKQHETPAHKETRSACYDDCAPQRPHIKENSFNKNVDEPFNTKVNNQEHFQKWYFC